MVKTIKKLIKETKEELKKLPGKISDYDICDGANETIRFGRMKFQGSNILTYSMEGYEEKLKKNNAKEMVWEKELLLFQRIFKKFQDKFQEFVDQPLFGGEEEDSENPTLLIECKA